MIRSEELALVQGWAATRRTLESWNQRRRPVLGAWIAGALLVAVALLAATWVIAVGTTPDPARVSWRGLPRPAEVAAYPYLLERNGLVRALHALPCVAVFMAGPSLPTLAAGYSGFKRVVHEKAGPLAI